ncbi:MAG: hypothetical protein COA42_01400 [Alteromonadaceae bacterium]|nr:MAG: hypothetical protein COA42_01400 [Alteromonadaceae bacterium]
MDQTEAQPEAKLGLLAKYDVNGDRAISADEISEKRKRVFSVLDVDLDGEVSFGEYKRVDELRRKAMLEARFNKLDIDNDGSVSGEEYSSYLGSFDRFDSNGDGYITGKEIKGKKTTKLAKSGGKKDKSLCVLWLCVRNSIH